MSGRISQSIAMGVGSSGAMTDVSSYVSLTEGVSRSWGRQSEFEDVNPGTFSFTLDNADGRFTPGNTASALATTVTEGMQVCWQLGSRLVAGTVQAIEPAFPSAESAWAQVRITCDDMLGNAARRTLGNIPNALFDAGDGYSLFPLDDPAGSFVCAQTRGSAAPPTLMRARGSYYFGTSTSHIPVDATVLTLSSADTGRLSGGFSTGTTYPTTTVGGWGLWIERESDASTFAATTSYVSSLGQIAMAGNLTSTWLAYAGTPVISVPPLLPGVAKYLSFRTTTVFVTGNQYDVSVEFLIDGNVVGSTLLGSSIAMPSRLQLMEVTCTGGQVFVARLSHSPAPINEYSIVAGPSATRLASIAATVPEITLDTLPTLSTATYGELADSTQSALDAINDVMRAEQGSVYVTTSGTLTSPTQKVKIRAADRPTSVSYTFNSESEAANATDFVRDITNLASTVTANGPDASATYLDDTLTARAGSKNVDESLPLAYAPDLYTWASDRSRRGANVGLRPTSVTIDAFTTPTDRSADLLALVPGDRIQVSGLPGTQLGFSTWDGWLLGVDETHDLERHEFELYLSPVTPNTAIFDTDRFMAGGDLSLSAGINSSVTSISVATSNAKFTTTGGDFPVDIVIDNEQMTATACSGATPQVMTVTRGVNGTTAASHSSGALLELATSSLFAF